jgi:hypothetical protein
MSYRKQLVNLDAMILRADFATQPESEQTYDMVPTISLRDFTQGALVGPNLRKPDFQRETNHWSPVQVLSLLQCFVNGDLIPSVILWKSPTNIFVIDGGHRLSVLRAWVEDDYGDGPVSLMFFDRNIPAVQKRVADKTRALINDSIGSFKHVQAKLAQADLATDEKRKLNAVISRALSIQWVNGSADKAESAFFKINTEGTPLDDIEELLLKTRHKPISIAARAVIRAATGHKYWSAFPPEASAQIEEKARAIHQLIFEPDLNTPIKTLDLPLGGAKGIRVALRTLLDFVLIACRNQQGDPKTISAQDDDSDGSATIDALRKIWELAARITGNDHGSLGLHPAVYFYGPSGQHQVPMFMGTAQLIKRKLLNNDPTFFRKFSACRARLEKALVEHKSTIAVILQGYVSKQRVDKYVAFLDALIDRLQSEAPITVEDVVSLSGLTGKVLVGGTPVTANDFSDDVKSETFLKKALQAAVTCSLCGGYLDPAKSVSYDHVVRRREGGGGASDNCDLTHPYCNQAVKN